MRSLPHAIQGWGLVGSRFPASFAVGFEGYHGPEASLQRLIDFALGKIILTISLKFPSLSSPASKSTSLDRHEKPASPLDAYPGWAYHSGLRSSSSPAGEPCASKVGHRPAPEAVKLHGWVGDGRGLGSFQKPLKIIWFQVTITPQLCGFLPNHPDAVGTFHLRLQEWGLGEEAGAMETDSKNLKWG